MDLSGRTDAEIREWLQFTHGIDEDIPREFLKSSLAPILPRYNDLTLFTLSATFGLLLLIDKRVWADISWAALMGPRETLGLLLFAAAGGALCLLHGLFRVRKSPSEKMLMLVFAVVVTAGTGIGAGLRMWETHQGWLIVFPIWNIANGAFLLLLFHEGVIDTDCITDEKAGAGRIVLSLLAIMVVLIFCSQVLRLNWLTAYSICICYTLTLHDSIERLFGRTQPLPS